MPTDKPALAGRLAAYLTERAEREGEPMNLEPADFEDALDRGIGSAFGVHWDAEGNLTRTTRSRSPASCGRGSTGSRRGADPWPSGSTTPRGVTFCSGEPPRSARRMRAVPEPDE